MFNKILDLGAAQFLQQTTMQLEIISNFAQRDLHDQTISNDQFHFHVVLYGFAKKTQKILFKIERERGNCPCAYLCV